MKINNWFRTGMKKNPFIQYWSIKLEARSQSRGNKVDVVSLQSKALRERWLLDGAGPEQDEVKRQLEQDEAKTRTLEDTINRSNLVNVI